MNENEVVLVTGASAGIGEALAREMVRRGWRVVVTARRKGRLEALCAETGAEWIAADLREEGAAGKIAEECRRRGWVVGGLVNNAGLGYIREFVEHPGAEVEDMLGVNVLGLVRMTREFLPGMVERGRGFVLNIGSTAAFQPIPYFGVYAASKAFVLSFSEALYEETRGSGVRVCVLSPGPVRTEFQRVGGIREKFFSKAQTVEEVVGAAMRLLEGRGAIGWTGWRHRVRSVLVGLAPRGLVRRAASWVIRTSGVMERACAGGGDG